MLSPKAQKAQENAQARRNIQNRFFDDGPYLDGEDVVIPSPARHEQLNRVLRSYGFHFEYYDIPGPLWTRPTSRPYSGRRYSPQAWLEWATVHYAKAWPKWEPPNG